MSEAISKRQARVVDVAVPPHVADAKGCTDRASFLLPGGLVDAWFERRSDILLVTFDNLSSVGEYDPPQPWLRMRAERAGFSLLGLIASRKDWYRNGDTAALIIRLRDAGLFQGFRRVLFVGASMGGFAAMVYAPLVPGAEVLAFSPQSTLARDRVPFEKRYRYAMRKWDWADPAFLDAADAAAAGTKITLIHDALIPEDRAHARRIAGAGVRLVNAPFLGHRAIRQIKAMDLLQPVIEDVARGTFDPVAFYRALRARRGQVAWQRAVVETAYAKGHQALVARALAVAQAKYPETGFAKREARRLAGAEVAPIARGRRLLGDFSDQPLVIEQGTDPEICATPPQSGPFRGLIQELPGGIVVPERAHDEKLASGVLFRDGSYCDLSRAWIRAGKSTPAPTLSPDEPVVDLAGTHLFGGHFRGHFGHFLVETTARLWALDHIGQRPDSILFLPYRGQVGPIERAIEGHEAFFNLMEIDVPLRTYGTALRVERLYVPELGFGWRDRYAGSPAYRQFMQGRLRGAVPAEGGDLLYVSRARLAAARGGILGETVIEENLARAGFDIFHPEKAPLAEQIARYKAAKVIVALDGSALHLAAYVMRASGRVAMILRRSKANAADYVLQYQSFAGITPDVIDVIRTDWVGAESTRVDFRSVGEIDFAALFDRLKALNYLPADFVPDLPAASDMQALLDEFSTRRGGAMRALGKGEVHFEELEETEE